MCKKGTLQKGAYMEYIVKVEGNEIARFKAREDAEHFASWKRDQMSMEFSGKQLEKYLKDHPTTKYGTKTLPGDVPLSATYPEYSEYVKELKELVIIEEDLPSLTVRDIDNELVLGSQYAVEVESWRMTEDGEETEDYQTYHYKVGEATRNPYMRHKVRSIRVCGSELYISVAERKGENK